MLMQLFNISVVKNYFEMSNCDLDSIFTQLIFENKSFYLKMSTGKFEIGSLADLLTHNAHKHVRYEHGSIFNKTNI